MARDIDQSRARRDPDDEDFPEPPRLRALRRLVTALTVALIVGILVIAATLAVRLTGAPSAGGPTRIAMPDASTLRLPPGETAVSVTLSGAFVGVLTEDADGVKRLRAYGEQGEPLWSMTLRESE